LERGLLISHPGEDYELLEERVLESLELRVPRVNKCGHVLDPSEDCPRVSNGADFSAPEECLTCTSAYAPPHHTADTTHSTQSSAPHHWSLKVYAANGLLSSGAWNAAWREMEKVDIEISVWIPDDMRRALDREEERRNRDGMNVVEDEEYAPIAEGKTPTMERDEWISSKDEERRARRMEGSRNVSTSSTASVAACSRTSYEHRNNYTPGISTRKEFGTNNSLPASARRQKLPLSTLLLRYLKRQFTQRPEILAVLVAVALGILLLVLRIPPHTSTLQSIVSSQAVSSPSKSDATLAVKEYGNPASTLLNHLPSSQAAKAPSQQLHERPSLPLPACTFPASLASAQEPPMTALPRDFASSILAAYPSPASVSSVVQGEDDGVTEDKNSTGQGEEQDDKTSMMDILHVLGSVVGPGDEGGMGEILVD